MWNRRTTPACWRSVTGTASAWKRSWQQRFRQGWLRWSAGRGHPARAVRAAQRLADAAAGWTLHRQPGDSSSRYSIIVRGAPPPRFTLQRLEKHPEHGQADRWVDVTATLQGLQAGGRRRPKP